MATLVTPKFFRHLWGLNIMPKWKMFVWNLWHNCLATSSNLHHRGITNISHYETCLHDNEDDRHIFWFCPLAIEAREWSELQVQPYDHPSLSLASWIEFWKMVIVAYVYQSS